LDDFRKLAAEPEQRTAAYCRQGKPHPSGQRTDSELGAKSHEDSR
jgi:hypothetical protein